MKDPDLIRRLVELASADRPALFVLSENAKAEDLDEALRIISALEQEPICPVSEMIQNTQYENNI